MIPGMRDEKVARLLRALSRIRRDTRLSGRVRLPLAYRNAVARLERDQANRRGADKTWVLETTRAFKEHFAALRRG